jgi:hypothetical protein
LLPIGWLGYAQGWTSSNPSFQTFKPKLLDVWREAGVGAWSGPSHKHIHNILYTYINIDIKKEYTLKTFFL